MIKYFNEKGELNVLLASIWDEDGDVYGDVYAEARENLAEFPVDSEAVRIYYAELMSSGTHGNYDAETLYRRAFL